MGDAIAFEADQNLLLDIPFWCSGGYHQDGLDELAVALGKLCEGEDWIEQHDIETGDSEAALIPYFIGATPELRLVACRKYGLVQAQTWLEPILGKEAFASVRSFVGSLPLLDAHPVDA
ncbi:hypothetical protein [Cupriavidus sp. TMH.W2]|uniref:hypothetical protein n=1 Tax=Cupriavidus sp. TMH.W2 TaxID=3434465 RepID=UPI003D78988B